MRVFAHNWLAFQVWRDTWRQWRWVGGGFAPPVRAGLDWAQVESVMRMRRVPARQQAGLLDALREMETATLEVLAEQHKKR